MALFNFIVLSYNTPPNLLKECLNSINNSIQHYKDKNPFGKSLIKKGFNLIDVKVVDDGSTKILPPKSIHPVLLEKNSKGLFWTRCQALKALDIKDDSFVIFIDSDDTISIDYVEKLMEIYFQEKAGEDADIYSPIMIEKKGYCIRQYQNFTNMKDLLTYRWGIAGRAYRKSLFNRAMAHPEFNTFLGEDLIHSYLMADQVRRIVGFDGIYYYYVREKTPEEGTEYRVSVQERKKLNKTYEDLVQKAIKKFKIKTIDDQVKRTDKVLIIEAINKGIKLEPYLHQSLKLLSEIKDYKDYKVRINVYDKQLVNLSEKYPANIYIGIKNTREAEGKLVKYYLEYAKDFCIMKDFLIYEAKDLENDLF